MVVLFMNETGFIGNLIIEFSNNLTGSLFLTLLIITIFLILTGLLFRLSLEFTAIIILPLLLVFMATTSEFLAVGGVFLLYLGVIIAKNFFLK